MVTLFDIVRQAQGGTAMDSFSRQFGLSLDQTQRAVDALLPAFSLGLQRSFQDPNAFAQLLELMASGRYAPFFDGGAQLWPAPPNGQHALERIFGSPEISRQIAAQASAMSGITAQVLQQMLPSLATVLMGGLFRYTTMEGLADFLRNWSDWLRTLARLQGGSPQPSSPTVTNPYEAWGDLMSAMLGGAARKPPPPEPPTDPWTSFMRGFLKDLPPNAAAPPPPAPPPSQPNPFEVLSQMFDAGRDVQEQYLTALNGILDGVLSAAPAGGQPRQA